MTKVKVEEKQTEEILAMYRQLPTESKKLFWAYLNQIIAEKESK